MKKIYIEISDICGLKCDFCPAPKGNRGVMDLATFRKAAFDARRFTRLIALHILGDPLSVGNLAEYLKIAKEANLSVEITTSGANLTNFDLLLQSPIKQINFSLDAIKRLKNAPFLMRRICDFCEYKINKKSEIFINLRVQKRAENAEIVEFLAQNLAFLPKAQNLNLVEKFTTILRNGLKSQNLGQNRVKLGNKIIVDFRDIFEWQIDSVNSQNLGEKLPIHCHSERSEESQKKNNRDSSPTAQNDNFKKIAESRLDSADFADSAPSTTNAESANKSQQTIEGIAVEVVGFLGDFGCETGLKSAKHSKSPKSPQDAPKSKLQTRDEFGICLALKSHIGILSNGTIVPCCIDALGNLALGNIKEISLDSALKSARAQKMLQGFRENRLVEHFCQKCDYKNRFT